MAFVTVGARLSVALPPEAIPCDAGVAALAAVGVARARVGLAAVLRIVVAVGVVRCALDDARPLGAGRALGVRLHAVRAGGAAARRRLHDARAAAEVRARGARLTAGAQRAGRGAAGGDRAWRAARG